MKILKMLVTALAGTVVFTTGAFSQSAKELEKSFAWLERAYKQRDTGLPEIKTDPLLNS